MTRLLLVLIGFLLCSLSINAQTAGDYRSRQTGNWNTVTTWQVFNSSIWNNLEDVGAGPYQNVIPSSSSGLITVYAGPTGASPTAVTVPSGYSATANSVTVASAASNTLIVANGGSLSFNGVMTLGSGPTGRGTLQVSGTFQVNQGATMAGGLGGTRITINSTGVYIHNYTTTAGQIYTSSSSWAAGSTLQISGYTTNSGEPTGLNQSFQNVTWNCSSQGSDIYFSGLNFNTVLGNLNIQNSNNHIVGLTTINNVTLNVTGNLSIGANSFLDLTGGTATGALNLKGNFTMSGDDGVGNFGSSTATFTFNGSSVQSYTSTNSMFSPVDIAVANLSILSVGGTNFISTIGAFTLNPSSTLLVGSTDAGGAIQTGTTAGNIRVSGTRTYASTSNIVYNGTGAQFIGNGFPSNVNLEIANTATAPSNTVTNNNVGITNVVGNLTLTSGALYIGSSNTLNIQSNFIVTGGTIGGSATSNLTFSGSGSLGTLTFATGAGLLNNLTVGRSSAGTVVLGSNLTVGGTIALSFGNLDFSGYTLTMNGGAITSSGTGLKSNASSSLVFGGSTYSGAVPFSGSGNQLNNLTFSTPGGAFTWSSAVTVNSNMNLTSGALTHTSGITMAASSTINMGGGSISGTSPTAASSYNVNYTASGNTGLELPTTATALNNLTIASSGTVSLASSGVTVNGNVLLSGGTFSIGANNLTMKGSTWTVGSGGSFSGTTGIVTFAGTTTVGGAGTISFSNVTTSSGSTLTLPSGNTNITGDLNLNSGSTFNNGGGTITLNGSIAQTVTGAGKSFSNVTVNKTGGIVDILPTLNLTGLFTIQTSTTVQSNGNLVLISTSDGTSGTASIAAIPSGASITGSVVAQRHISAKGRVYHDISSPVQAATVQQIMNSGITVTGFTGSSFPCSGCATNNPSMYWYDESVPGAIANGYTAMTSASATMSSGRGYNVLVRNEVGAATMALTGVINSGALSLPVTFTNSGNPSADGWNFVGNPYPSSINWDASSFWTKSQIAGNMISVWDAGANQYKTWNGSTGSLGSGTIGQGQGFWFQCSATPTLSITEGAKTSTTGAFLREMSQPIHTVELILRGASVEDRAYVQKLDGSAPGFDPMDGPKLTIENFSLSTVVDDNRNLAINAVGEIISSGKMPLSLANIDNGDYTFTQQSLGDFQSVKISILDKYTNTIHDLSNGAAYSFTFEDNSGSRTTDRFVLIFGDNVNEYNQLSLYPNPVSKTLTVYINSDQTPQGEIIDIMGKSIGIVNWEKALDGPSWKGTFDMQSQSAGVYFVKVGTQVKRFLKN